MNNPNLFKKSIIIIHQQGLKIFFERLFQFLEEKSQYFFLLYFIFKTKRFQSEKLEDLVDFVFKLKIIKPAQIREEILELLKILQKNKPKIILEIGTANGGTLFLLSRIAPKDAVIISIDLPKGEFGGGYPTWKIPLYKSFTKGNQKMHLLREDSHNRDTLKKVKEILNSRKVDFLFIDGDHSYGGVKKDFEMYSKLVERESNSFSRHNTSSLCSQLSGRKILERDKAEIQNKRNNFFTESDMGRDWSDFYLIAFHDIVPGLKENVGGVPEFWEEIKKKFPYEKIVQDWNQGGYGIGIIKFDLISRLIH